MADIFADDYEDLAAGVLNYRLLDEPAIVATPPTPTLEPSKTSDDDTADDTVGDLQPAPMPMRARRRSSVTRYSLLYEVDFSGTFALSALFTSHHRPKLSHFEPLKVLGHGLYGKVLLVRERSTGRLFAQKQLKKALLVVNDRQIHTKNYQRTLNEKTILEKVNHPNIVKLYYAFQDNDKVYLILEYLDGGEVFHHLAQQKYMSEKDASFYIAQIILALRYLHLHLKVIYRDLKPENCMLNAAGNLVLTDFGLSKVSDDDTDAKHSMIGTAQYMAPEVIKGDDYDYSVDWWSLGCVAYDMLTGAPPFTGQTNEKIMDKVVHSKKYLKFPFYLSLDAKDFLRKLLQANPAKRLDIDGDFDKLKLLRFFRYVDWDQLMDESRDDYIPPILPVITDPILAENFDEEFTSMPLTPPPDSHLLGIESEDILHVKGFTYTNESYLVNVFSGTT